jgi:hypothetical protein
MKQTGLYNSVEDDFDIDHEITEMVELTKKHIEALRDKVGVRYFKVIAKVVINEYLEAL